MINKKAIIQILNLDNGISFKDLSFYKVRKYSATARASS